MHHFEIRYKDIIPLQVGIRSGAPTVENLKGTLLRTLAFSKAFIFHIVQLVGFLISFSGFYFGQT